MHGDPVWRNTKETAHWEARERERWAETRHGEKANAFRRTSKPRHTETRELDRDKKEEEERRKKGDDDDDEDMMTQPEVYIHHAKQKKICQKETLGSVVETRHPLPA